MIRTACQDLILIWLVPLPTPPGDWRAARPNRDSRSTSLDNEVRCHVSWKVSAATHRRWAIRDLKPVFPALCPAVHACPARTSLPPSSRAADTDWKCSCGDRLASTRACCSPLKLHHPTRVESAKGEPTEDCPAGGRSIFKCPSRCCAEVPHTDNAAPDCSTMTIAADPAVPTVPARCKAERRAGTWT